MPGGSFLQFLLGLLILGLDFIDLEYLQVLIILLEHPLDLSLLLLLNALLILLLVLVLFLSLDFLELVFLLLQVLLNGEHHIHFEQLLVFLVLGEYAFFVVGGGLFQLSAFEAGCSLD